MDFKQKRTLTQIEICKQALLNDKADISLTNILSSDSFHEIIGSCREFRERTYTPLKTLFIFIKQVINSDKSCKNAVAGAIAEQLTIEKKSISSNTGPYCKARQRLPEKTVVLLVKETGKFAENNAKDSWKWKGRTVKMTDGTILTMPDTEENQKIFPQHGNQKEGIGFPMARLVAVMSLTVGTVIGYAMDKYKGKGTGEHSLLRSIFDCINPNDILLGDRYYPSFFLISDLKRKDADGVFKAQGQRKYDFRKGEILGRKDHVIEWEKPKRPTWMNEVEYEAYPNKICVREFKAEGCVYVTTLLNPKKYNKQELKKLYALRWQIEINLKNLKSTMNMDMLSCHTPEMVKKEIGVHFLAYNLIRIIIAEACSKCLLEPNQVSFKGTVQFLNNFMPFFLKTGKETNNMYEVLLRLIVKNKIGNRPGRIEPRAIKRRRKPFALLKNPRKIVRQKLLQRLEKKILRNAYA